MEIATLKKLHTAAPTLFIISSMGNISGKVDSTAKSIRPPESIDYSFPDLRKNALVVDGKRLWFKPIIANITDHNAFWQDDPSLNQVGRQENTFDLRAARFGLNIRSKDKLKWIFTFTTDYQESRTWDDAYVQAYGLKLSSKPANK